MISVDVLGANGYTRDKPAGPDSLFLALDTERYKNTLTEYHRDMISAAQRKQGGFAGVLPSCMLWQGTCIWGRLVHGAEQGARCSCCCKQQFTLPVGGCGPVHQWYGLLADSG